MRRARVVTATLLCVVGVGCASDPPGDAALRSIDRELEELRRQRDESMAMCGGDPECEASVRRQYLDLTSRAFETRLAIIEAQWEASREGASARER